jgi:hypothetical protein
MKLLKFIGGLIGVFILVVAGGVIRDSESIPDNAKIFVYPLHKQWSPDSWFMTRDFNEGLADSSRAEGVKKYMAERIPAVYADVKDKGKFDGFNAFPVLLEEPGNIMNGWDGSLLWSWIAKKPRWNTDGSWNY